MKKITNILVAGALLFGGAAKADEAEQKPAEKPQSKPCAAAEFHQFDFWLGDWDVTPAGKDNPTAENHIRSMHNGCLVREYYKNGGYTGSSMSFYDHNDKRWHQTWIGAGGQALYIAGSLNDKGQMVMSDTALAKVQERTINRITWTPNKDGSVRQIWDVSKDGKSWKTVFDGAYTRQVKADD